MPRKNVLSLLQGGDRRSVGRADEVAEIVCGNPALFPELIAGLWLADPLVRMRAADASEKVTRKEHGQLQNHKKELLGLLAETQQQEVRWHLAAMVTRLALNARERLRVMASLKGYLEDRSSIVRTFALQGLVDLVADARADGVGLGKAVVVSASIEGDRYVEERFAGLQTYGRAGRVGECRGFLGSRLRARLLLFCRKLGILLGYCGKQAGG